MILILILDSPKLGRNHKNLYTLHVIKRVNVAEAVLYLINWLNNALATKSLYCFMPNILGKEAETLSGVPLY